ncbi:MAG: DUF5989 family protein [Bacteroidetes bacterium]|nr:DUF5989 family protein [Bacteroidota bacterium]
MAKTSVLIEFLHFLKERKKLWLMPIILILVGIGLILVLVKGSALAPFIYSLF